MEVKPVKADKGLTPLVSPPRVSDLDNYHTQARWLVQTSTVIVTGVQVNPTETGLEIVLEIPPDQTVQPLIFSEENTLIIDILGAVLQLPESEEFRVENPNSETTEVTVTQLDAESIRITITGKERVPIAEVKPSADNLVLSVTPSSSTRETPREEIEVVATGEQQQESYFVPNASTATGTDAPIMETPFSVKVVPQEVIRQQQAIRIQDVLSNVSGVVSGGSSQGRGINFNIRGFGTPSGSSVPVLKDGYRIYGVFVPAPETANLEQVEVLKGPASILYGEIEPGGIINLVSKKPLPQFFNEIELQVGEWGLVRPRFDLTGPIDSNGNLLYRLNGLYKHEWSFRDFDRAMERYSVAPVLAWKIGNNTDVLFSVEYINDTGPADFGLVKYGDGVAPIPRTRVINNPDDTVDTDSLSAGYSFEHRFNENWKLRNSFRYLSYNFDFSVVALPGFFADDRTFVRFWANQGGQQRSYSFYTNAVGKFATGSINHELLVGIDLNHSEDRITTRFGEESPIDIFNPDYNIVPKPLRSELPLFGDTTNEADRLGIYLQNQVYFLDNLILVAGVRYDTVTLKTTNAQTDLTDAGESEQTDDAFIPRVGLLYRLIRELSLFANYSQSFRPSTQTTASGEALEPERGKGFEVGVKTELFQKKLLATLTYFDITKENVVVTDPANPFFSIAAGEQQSQGFELDVTGEILPGWKIIASYSYIDAKVTEDTDPSLVGNRLFGVPYNMASLWMTYEIQSGALQGLGFGAGLNYVGDRFGDLANTYTVGDYFIGNAAIFYQRDCPRGKACGHRYRFALNFRNISDADYIEAVAGIDSSIEPGQPFTVIGSFSVEF
ncbi:MAG: TonB-dependent siderophore receptor [Gomphosphaeria aponina SAG 52.96 = DSM 107014]|uniref:TonB-dependent siderophore receptor n=1 Tax=Gomphosphaeria aponina SAG 52.96 = DSM 107014 TaxID=1521640 RepID=A0A941JRT9_9CHRO|nr:TonB-dependent siderophore receptor [Gomphosphaeria aponina SAG 52.96 = DSM 107014]